MQEDSDCLLLFHLIRTAANRERPLHPHSIWSKSSDSRLRQADWNGSHPLGALALAPPVNLGTVDDSLRTVGPGESLLQSAPVL